MAEKEERILIKKQINYHPPYGGWCGDGKEIVLTRQEAINVIANAFNSEITILSEEACLEGAEVALNALLGEDK